MLLLQSSRWLADAAPTALAYAAEHMALQTLRRREVLMRQGQPFDGLAVVVQGSLQAMQTTLDGYEAAVATAQAGDPVGLVDLLRDGGDHPPTPLYWIAHAGGAMVAVMPKAHALQWLTMADMGLRAARWLARYVSDGLAWQALQGLHPVAVRICAALLHLAAPGGALTLPTQAELGWRLNTTRESVARVLQRLQRDGVLARREHGWQIVDMPALQRLARPPESLDDLDG
ncbi:Crp/Fnr family transcriptional regulator [Tepidimonas charontis]|uniref:cAMP-activated global transcriptional regulator CRP n=1 Tax=Tepidimonas charontis TaxID=2267262 RepID=A0A554XC92_9BURK|nr:Crp/Fnr family transcriptional regulator [Tepidimonas charontis]TSE33471.1 cAMP-activated global transcriptional regulator CRP [Tepidimonas charontis]